MIDFENLTKKEALKKIEDLTPHVERQPEDGLLRALLCNDIENCKEQIRKLDKLKEKK